MPKRKTRKIKQSLSWTIASLYLYELENFPELREDEKFQRLYNALVEYVDKKLPYVSNGDVVDSYVIVEQEI